MILTNPKYNLVLEVSDSFIQSVSQLVVNHYPNEFGGFLIGYYSDDLKKLHVTGYILPKKYSSSKISFTRNTKGTESIFKKMYAEEPRRYYVGEWHSHPNGSTGYSNTDLLAMVDIVKCETVKIHNPILLILSVEKNTVMDFDFYIYKDQEISKYEK